MELRIKQRVVLLNVLNEVTGNIAEIRILGELRSALSFSEDEHVEFEIQEGGGQMAWNGEKDRAAEIEMGEVARWIIADRLRELDRQRQLTADHLEIIDLFPELEE